MSLHLLVEIVVSDDDHVRYWCSPMLMARRVLRDVLDVLVDVVEDELAWWRCMDDAVGHGAWSLVGPESTT